MQKVTWALYLCTCCVRYQIYLNLDILYCWKAFELVLMTFLRAAEKNEEGDDFFGRGEFFQSFSLGGKFNLQFFETKQK